MSHDLRSRRRPIRAARSVSPIKLTVALVGSGIAVIVLFAAGIAAEQYHSRRPVAATSPSVKATPAGPGLGDAVRDGKLVFVVSRVDCSRKTIGIEHFKRTAAGKFCVVSLSVRNAGDGAKYFVGKAQKAYAGDTEYRSDELAGIYANRGTEAFLRKLDPGEKVSGKLVFDIPKAARLTRLELHDSLLSGGAGVTVS
ncbi:DUF4352 domain-containing protein [Actinoplanes sp. L3-i22]|uniref:DUF4352 domain-containing protein n=1 Tax=Actinoplanes sp. L3-i22 TaxID=2836373 RepID=UPI001C789CCC|nr:DUF4352 domain-containing protein [Actinoplanes sp. L3-i22]BCY07215.1 hypothetical protein L3i22_023030 [Actinoplanes sp. L3-i22]